MEDILNNIIILILEPIFLQIIHHIQIIINNISHHQFIILLLNNVALVQYVLEE